jgi:hypothetical protein
LSADEAARGGETASVAGKSGDEELAGERRVGAVINAIDDHLAGFATAEVQISETETLLRGWRPWLLDTNASVDAIGYVRPVDGNSLAQLLCGRGLGRCSLARADREVLASQYSIMPGRPDLDESFAYWADTPATIPHHAALPAFTGTLHAHSHVVRRAADAREFACAELAITAGSLPTDATGGAVSPRFHQVGSHQRPNRLSTVSFVNPPLDGSARLLAAPDGADVDLRERGRANDQGFGLPAPPGLDDTGPAPTGR